MTTNFLENYKLEGTKLSIFHYPEPVLSKVATPVTKFDTELHELCKNMLFTMYHAPGVGLAAPQVGISQRIFVVDVDYEREEVVDAKGDKTWKFSNFQPNVFINPKFISKTGEYCYEEGCLSVPGVYEEVKRALTVVMQYQDILGNTMEIEADELLAVCLQHENDHLDGIVFLDRLSMIKKNILKKKFINAYKKKHTSI